MIREALPRREEDSVDVSALLAGVTKSRRSRSTSARPVKPEEPSTEDVKPITLKRRLLNTMGFTKTPRERSSSEDSKSEPVEAVVVPAGDAVEGVVVGDEPPPLTSLAV